MKQEIEFLTSIVDLQSEILESNLKITKKLLEYLKTKKDEVSVNTSSITEEQVNEIFDKINQKLGSLI